MTKVTNALKACYFVLFDASISIYPFQNSDSIFFSFSLERFPLLSCFNGILMVNKNISTKPADKGKKNKKEKNCSCNFFVLSHFNALPFYQLYYQKCLGIKNKKKNTFLILLFSSHCWKCTQNMMYLLCVDSTCIFKLLSRSFNNLHTVPRESIFICCNCFHVFKQFSSFLWSSLHLLRVVVVVADLTTSICLFSL